MIDQWYWTESSHKLVVAGSNYCHTVGNPIASVEESLWGVIALTGSVDELSKANEASPAIEKAIDFHELLMVGDFRWF